MFLDQLIRVLGGLGEFFILLVLLVLIMIGVAVWSQGFPLAGMLNVGAAIWVIASAATNKR